jgi:hypothetical protein
MLEARGMVYSQGRLEALKARHAALEAQIREEEKHFTRDAAQLKTLKRLKLIIKEEMEGMRRAS